jgi:hypothetical protein
LVENESGPISFDYGIFYQLAFTNPEFVFLQREVNVFYSAGVFNDISIAQEAYNNFSDPLFYPDTSTVEPFAKMDFTNIDEVTLLYGEDIADLGNLSISYTLVFRYQNFTASVIVSAMVDDYQSEYALAMKGRLRQAIIFYAALVTRELPVSPLAHIPQLPCSIDPVETFAAPPDDASSDLMTFELPANAPANAIFFDDFEDPEWTYENWDAVTGDWEVIDGAYFCRSYDFWCFALAGDPSMRDYTFSVDMMGVEGVDRYVYVAGIENHQYFQIKIRSNPYNDVALFEDLPGLDTNHLDTSSYRSVNNHWYHVEVVVRSNQITVFIDNTQVMDYYYTRTLELAGKIGLGLQIGGSGTTAAYFDNVVVVPNQ